MDKSHWLDKSQYQKIRYRAKKMGAEKVDLSHYKHYVRFRYITILFGFKPFTYEIRIFQPWNLTIFHDKETAEAFKAAIDTTLEFVEYLKEFNKNEVDYETCQRLEHT